MNFTSLRRIAQNDVNACAALSRWPLHDASLAQRMTYAPLPSGSMMVAIDAYRQSLCWRGYVDLAEWLTYTAPELARLAQATNVHAVLQSPVHPEKVRQLFEASDQPLTMPIPELAYELLHLRPYDAGRQNHDRLLSLLTPQGRIWFSEYPAIGMPAVDYVSAAMRSVPLQIAWSLGNSFASRGLVKVLRPGDVLLIKNETFELTSADKKLGHFSINECGEISVQAASYDESQSPDDSGEQAEISAGVALRDIPLRLDFILQRSMMTVAQIDTLYQGQVLQLDPKAEQKIEIIVNGMRIAKGELVELNGQLGVELHDITLGQTLSETNRVQ